MGNTSLDKASESTRAIVFNEPISASLLRAIGREHILEAIRRIDLGENTGFADSTKYDLLYHGRRYPPKRVAGLALEIVTGERYGPYAFKGGQESACFRALQAAGFTIAAKLVEGGPSLHSDLQEVARLQRQATSDSKSDARRQSVLVREAIPNHIRSRLHLFEPLFTDRGYSFVLEGSKGKGRKTEAPWVRVFDPEMVSGANGWSVGVYFPRDVDAIYMTLGCGATTLIDGGLVDVKPDELARRVAWARALGATADFDAGAFLDRLELQGDYPPFNVGRTSAYARIVQLGGFDEEAFYSGLEGLLRRLLDIYDAQRLGLDPSDQQQAVEVAEAAVSQVISPAKGRSQGQGRGLSAVERIAVELRAMEVAQAGLLAAGFSDIRDVSAKEPYDYSASKDGLPWLIEVKGTTSAVAEQFLLTAAELKLHMKHKGSTALVLISGIQLIRKNGATSAVGGVLALEAPWDPEQWEFEPTSFRAKRR